MNILVTGAKGMCGTALVNNLKNIRDNKNRTRPGIKIDARDNGRNKRSC